MQTRTLRKSIIILCVILFLGALIMSGWYYGRLYFYFSELKDSDPQYQNLSFKDFLRQQKEQREFVNQAEELKRAEAQDTVGGKTAEETLNLFVDALKKKDIDGAVKYARIRNREEIKKQLVLTEQKGNWDKFINVINSHKAFNPGASETFLVAEFYDDSTPPISVDITMVKNDIGTWKVTDI